MVTSQQIKAARAMLGWGVRELGEKTGLVPGTITRIENGKEGLVASLRKIEQAFVDAGIDFPDQDTVSMKRLREKAE